MGSPERECPSGGGLVLPQKNTVRVAGKSALSFSHSTVSETTGMDDFSATHNGN